MACGCSLESGPRLCGLWWPPSGRTGTGSNACVDDFTATGRLGHRSTADEATSGKVKVQLLFGSLGVHVHPSNGQSKDKQKRPLMGFLVNTKRRRLLFLAVRQSGLIVRARSLLIAAFRDGFHVRHRTLQRLICTAVLYSMAVPSACFLLQRLSHAQGGIDREAPADETAAIRGVESLRRQSGWTRLSHGAINDLRWFSGM